MHCLTHPSAVISIWVPIGYTVFLVGSLYIFSNYYRKRKTGNTFETRWHDPLEAREVYLTLKDTKPEPPRPVLIGALVKRATEAFAALKQLTDKENALNLLVQKGQVGESLLDECKIAQRIVQFELSQIITEADHYNAGFGSSKAIFKLADEILTHQKIKDAGKLEDEPSEKVEFLSAAPYTYLTPGSLTLIPSLNDDVDAKLNIVLNPAQDQQKPKPIPTPKAKADPPLVPKEEPKPEVKAPVKAPAPPVVEEKKQTAPPGGKSNKNKKKKKGKK